MSRPSAWRNRTCPGPIAPAEGASPRGSGAAAEHPRVVRGVGAPGMAARAAGTEGGTEPPRLTRVPRAGHFPPPEGWNNEPVDPESGLALNRYKAGRS
jgi:hypothetical protein